MIPLRLSDLTPQNIQDLVTNSVPEGRSLDYKQALIGGTDEDKKEFLADVASFATARGGHMVFGVVEQRSNGKPTGIPESAQGLAGVNVDAEKLRLENMVRDGIAPRVPPLEWGVVNGFPAGPVIVLGIRKSWTGPHMVTFKGSSKFYSRNSAGKYQLDVGEIRSAFASGEELAHRVRRFRDDRVGRIVAGEVPLHMEPRPKTVQHIVPVSAFEPAAQIDPQLVEAKQGQLAPINPHAFSGRYNLDGFATYAPDGKGGTYSYVQVFRNGALEAVETDSMARPDGPSLLIPAKWEEYMVGGVERYSRALKELGATLPFFVMISFVEAMNLQVYVEGAFRAGARSLDREVIFLPDVTLDHDDVDFPATLRPVFDSVWQATGLPRSANYDSSGQWKGKPR